MSSLKVAGLTKAFGRTVAVDGISFEIPSGALGTFLGPSGCGKTTTLRMVAGLERPDAGRIELGERVLFAANEANLAAERRQIGMVFQSYAVWPHMTVAENVAFPLRAQRFLKAQVERRARDALRLVRLDDLAERYPSQLSGGQQQRVALARAIVFEPRLLLLDEPLSNLDASLREEMRLELRALQQRLGITTLFVTHDQDEALAMSDTLAIMNGGRIVQAGAPRDIYERPNSLFVAGFVGWRNMFPAEIAARDAVRIGAATIAPAATDGLAVGSKATACIRPEDLAVRTAGDEPYDRGVLRGRVQTALYMATHVEVEVALDGASAIAHAAPDARFAHGQEVEIVPAPARLIVFAADAA